jgi:uncharacterized lipoprotein NlpE involved in copper resistance
MKTIILSFTFLVFFISGCGKQPENTGTTGTTDTRTTEPVTEKTNVTKTETASINWVGNYFGTLPCADCPGIETTISLNKDHTYNMKMVYMERDVKPIEDNGTIAIEDGNKIILTSSEGSKTQYLLGENTLTQLDAEGKEFTGDIAASFILKKQ